MSNFYLYIYQHVLIKCNVCTRCYIDNNKIKQYQHYRYILIQPIYMNMNELILLREQFTCYILWTIECEHNSQKQQKDAIGCDFQKQHLETVDDNETNE